MQDIEKLFALARYATVSTNISRLKILMEEDKEIRKKVEQIKSTLIV